MDESRRGERLIGVILLAVLLFSPAIMAVFAAPTRVFGLPTLIVYVFVAWAAVVGLLARIARGADRGPDGR